MSAIRSSSSSRLPREISLLCSTHVHLKHLQHCRRLLSSRSIHNGSSLSRSVSHPKHIDFPDLPKFKARGSDIQVLESPHQFYTTLLDNIRKAKRRIFLASLYIGKEETELVIIPILAALWYKTGLTTVFS